MSVTVKPHHPLQELIAKCLHGIGGVPPEEQRRMVNRVAREAVRWHEAEIKKLAGLPREELTMEQFDWSEALRRLGRGRPVARLGWSGAAESYPFVGMSFYWHPPLRQSDLDATDWVEVSEDG